VNYISTHIIAVSHRVASLLETCEHVPKDKISIIYNGINTRDFQSLAKIRAQNSILSKVNVVMIGRHIESKGFIYGIRAFKRAYQVHNNLFLKIFGEFSTATCTILEELRELPATSYELFSELQTHDTIYGSASIIVHTPISPEAESFGLVYLEGILSGADCIFTVSGILHEIAGLCDSQNVFVVDYKNSDQIYSKLINILARQNKYSSISQSKLIPRFDLKVTSKQVIDLMQSFELTLE